MKRINASVRLALPVRRVTNRELVLRITVSSIEFTSFQHRLANETVAGNQY